MYVFVSGTCSITVLNAMTFTVSWSLAINATISKSCLFHVSSLSNHAVLSQRKWTLFWPKKQILNSRFALVWLLNGFKRWCEHNTLRQCPTDFDRNAFISTLTEMPSTSTEMSHSDFDRNSFDFNRNSFLFDFDRSSFQLRQKFPSFRLRQKFLLTSTEVPFSSTSIEVPFNFDFD